MNYGHGKSVSALQNLLLTLVNEILETSRNKHMYNNLVNNCTDLWLSFPKQQIVTEACLWQLSASFRLDTLLAIYLIYCWPLSDFDSEKLSTSNL